MKKALLALIIITLSTSCRKEWTCESKTTMNGYTTTTITKFTGSRDDMKDHEASGNFTIYGVVQTTECKK